MIGVTVMGGRRRQSGIVLLITLFVLILVTTMGLASLKSARLDVIVSNNLAEQISAFNRAESEANTAERVFRIEFQKCTSAVTECQENIISNILADIDSDPPQYKTDLKSQKIDLFQASGINSTVRYLGFREQVGGVPKLLHFFQFVSSFPAAGKLAQYRIETIYQICTDTHGGPCPDPLIQPQRVAWRELDPVL